MKINTLLALISISFLSYWGYKRFYNNNDKIVLKPNLNIEIPVEEKIDDDEIIMEITDDDIPLSPLQKLVQNHFQIAHR